MKATNLATVPSEKACKDKLTSHDHIHAANCGHKSFVHGDHICFLHDGHYHYMHDGHTHVCEGPSATKTVQTKTVTTKTVQKNATVHSIDAARNSKKK